MLCARCGHETMGEKHLGFSAMDMHHEAVAGQPPRGLGRVTWQHDAGAVLVDYVGPDGAKERVRVFYDGRREPIGRPG